MYAGVFPASNRSRQTPGTTAPSYLARPRQISLFSPDAEIYRQGDRSGLVYRVEFGAVRVYRLHAGGRRQVVSFHLAGETFGLEADRTRRFFAEAMVHSGLTVVGNASAETTSEDLLALALRQMISAQEHLLVLGRQSALEKLAAFLLDIAERQGDLDPIDLPMTRIDIGDYLGLTIETVSRSFSKFRDEGILRLHGARTVELLKPDRLRLLCQ
ncbi:helix-turn-helix domain-containing protein [Pararhizobium antarcticum]|uniref:Transcriptional regulator n=1 Tax=Pararhizobium antarcticum TaxID=1798805 RepID=A0A657LRZ1_9HYPH|nr:helix-turn-helix domain-containing protein [Pararhizobium antarcticum]OJF92740.1 transcriptional regulator [Rhizobium sp. 58]OJF95102.1 transcriptional regulator [Pararhizobium antarcticum]